MVLISTRRPARSATPARNANDAGGALQAGMSGTETNRASESPESFRGCLLGHSNSWGDAPGSPRRIRPVADYHDRAPLALSRYRKRAINLWLAAAYAPYGPEASCEEGTAITRPVSRKVIAAENKQ